MNENLRKILLRYGMTTAVAAAVTLLLIYLFGFGEASDIADKHRILSDSFTIPGVILIMLTILAWIASEGIFDGISYAFRQAGAQLIPFLGLVPYENFYDYKEKKKKERKARGYSFLLFVGIAFLIIGVIFVILYKCV